MTACMWEWALMLLIITICLKKKEVDVDSYFRSSILSCFRIFNKGSLPKVGLCLGWLAERNSKSHFSLARFFIFNCANVELLQRKFYRIMRKFGCVSVFIFIILVILINIIHIPWYRNIWKLRQLFSRRLQRCIEGLKGVEFCIFFGFQEVQPDHFFCSQTRLRNS